jgi:TatD DNase family protein
VWVDSHCHLDFPDFADDLEATVARAGEAKVATLLTICTRLTKADQVLAVAERFPNVFATVGVHPHEVAAEGVAAVDRLERLAQHPKVVGLGETGLDFHYDHSPRDLQEASFRVHIAAARGCRLPVVIHTRNADDALIRILDDEMAKEPFAGVLHCFSATERLARHAVALGLYISFSGIITFKKADELRAIASALPDDRLLVETDAPYLAPVPRRGRRNEPAYTVLTGHALASLRGTEATAMARTTTANFFRLFTKAAPPCG